MAGKGKPPRLTREQIESIEDACRAHKATAPKVLADTYGVSVRMIQDIARGWRPKRYTDAAITADAPAERPAP